ncbi:MAG: hypothetical protein IJ860_04305 [Eubacterium sp.]|nr:hypothetical protein [Eubacterium sp.]
MKKRLFAAVLSASLMLSSVTVFAESTQQRLNAAKEAQYQNASALQTTQERIAALESKKGEAEAYLQELNDQMTDLSGQIKDLQEQYADKQHELDAIGVELGKARLEEEKQRKNMKLRIQYMYEHSESTGMLEALFSADSFSDFLNRADNIANISAYDRNMLEEYCAICETIQTAEEKAEKEQAEISALEKKTSKKKAEMQELADQTSGQVAEYAANLEDEEGTAAKLIGAIQQQEATIQVLTAQVEEEIRAAEAAAAAERQRQAAAAAAAAEAEAAQEEAEEAEYDTKTYDYEEEDTYEEDSYEEDASDEEDTSYEEDASYETEEAVSEEDTGSSVEEESTDTTSSGSESSSSSSDAASYSYDGTVLNRRAGTVTGPSGKETYYNLNMSGVVNIMRNMGNTDDYWVRDDGVKMLGDYVMVAANLDTHPRGSIVDSSLGKAIVCDTGTFAYSNPNQLDVAVDW